MKYLLQYCCRTTRSCRHKALLSSSGPDSIKKDSPSARMASEAAQCRIRFGQGRRPNSQPMCGVAEGQPTLRYPSHENYRVSFFWPPPP